jgi:hypothetical protein
MNDMEKTVTELHGMHKTAKDSIKKNPNHVMMVQKEKNKMKHWTPPKDKDKEKVFDEPSSSKLKTKASLVLFLMRNASTATKRDIASGTVRSTWRRKRRRREVKLPLQV